MKIFISILLMMFFTYNQVFAIAPLNEQTITAAQKYGIDNSKIKLDIAEKMGVNYSTDAVDAVRVAKGIMEK